MSKSTMVELVVELEKISPRTPLIEEMIAEAKAGEYHDFKNQKYACGKVAVVEKLRRVRKMECDVLAQRVINGEYDEEADAEDIKRMREDAIKDGMPEAMLKELGLDDGSPSEPGRRALRPDAQGFDEIRIRTVPRYKTSGMSGDEWRIHAEVEFFRKGIKRHRVGLRDVQTAAGFLYAEFSRALDDGKGHFAGEGNFCDQEGCAEVGTVKKYLKKRFCREGHGEDVRTPEYRLFCAEHSRRGDCGLEDADANYAETP